MVNLYGQFGNTKGGEQSPSPPPSPGSTTGWLKSAVQIRIKNTFKCMYKFKEMPIPPFASGGFSRP